MTKPQVYASLGVCYAELIEFPAVEIALSAIYSVDLVQVEKLIGEARERFRYFFASEKGRTGEQLEEAVSDACQILGGAYLEIVRGMRLGGGAK